MGVRLSLVGKHDVGCGQVHPGAAGLEAQQEDRHVPVAESVEHLLAVASSPIQIRVFSTAGIELLAQQAEKFDELAEYKRAAPAGDDFGNQFADLILVRVDLV